MKKIINNLKSNYRWAVVLFGGGILLGWLVFHSPAGAREAVNQEQELHEGHDHLESESTVWTCSMHPQIRQDKPGQCPICGMDLIPLSEMQTTENDIDPAEIQMTESAARLADVQTSKVRKGKPEKTLFLQGKVRADERNIAELTARFSGRIEKLFVSFTGENVQKGEKLATIYSPELVTAQRELLEALTYRDERPALYQAARSKLRLWDLTDGQINEIEEQGEPRLYFDIRSPISGTVTRRNVALGDYVHEGSGLFEVTDLTHVWITFDAYESNLPWIREGDRVTYTVPSVPGKTFNGIVSYIDPFIDPSTRVAKVRVDRENQDLTLKPEMFVNGTVESAIAAGSDEILIPRSSILWTGKRAVVYVKVADREQPSFIYREVLLGPEAGDFYVVSDGLAEGEEIAVNGVFKIDAAAQLAGKPSMMNPQGAGQSVVPAAFRKQMQDLYEAYILMKNAFVGSDAAAVKAAADEVSSTLQQVEMELLQGDDHMRWMQYLEELSSGITGIAGGADIAAQRVAFAAFNDAFYTSLKDFGLEEDTVYYQYCPMANGDQGAFWLSEISEIENPYFGEAMLSCGETRETLAFDNR